MALILGNPSLSMEPIKAVFCLSIMPPTVFSTSFIIFYLNDSANVGKQRKNNTAKIREALDDYTDEMIVRFITGSADVRDDRQWQAFQDNCETLGAGRLLDLCEEKP